MAAGSYHKQTTTFYFKTSPNTEGKHYTFGTPYPVFRNREFNQPRIENIRQKKSRKFQKAKLECATRRELR